MKSPTARTPAQPDYLSIPEALQRAHAHWNAGQAAQAEVLCQRILEAVPHQADALHLMGLMAHAYGQLDRALYFLREACASSLAPPLYWSNLAEMFRQRGLLAEGETAARTATTKAPGMTGAWNNLGIILQEMGRYAESRECLEKALKSDPRNAEILNNLGNTCMRQGEPVKAEFYWRKALKLRPNYAQPHSNLAKLLTDRGLDDEAREHATRAIAVDPQFADAYINLAALEMARDHSSEALRVLNALLAFVPQHATALASRAIILERMDRLDEALQSAEQAVAVAPNHAEGQYALGCTYQALGRVEEAMSAYERAANLPGTKAEDAMIRRAVLFMEQGQKSEADAAFERVLGAFPRSASAWYNWSDLKKFTPDDPLIPRMQALFDRGDDLLPNDRMVLHFALGKAYLDAGESTLAFIHLNQGNAQKRESISYDPLNSTRYMKEISETFSSELLTRRQGLGAKSAVPIFIVGMPRSGTTMTEQILASHSSIQGAGELSYMQQIVSDIPGFPTAVRDATAQTLHGWGQAYLDRVTKLSGGARYVVDKMPANFFYAGLIHMILPEARIIHCRRNAADTCLSCYSKLFAGEQRFAYEQTELGLFHRDYARLTAHWRDVLPASHFLEIDYENVVEDVEGEARRMLTFLGLELESACVDFHRTQRSIRTASVNQVREPVYKTSAGRWKAHAQQLQPLLTALGMAADPT